MARFSNNKANKPNKQNFVQTNTSSNTKRVKQGTIQKLPNKVTKLTSLQLLLGIKLINGRLPIGIISVNDGFLNLICATLSCIDINQILTISQIKSAVVQTIKFYNSQVIHHNVDKGTKLYKKVWLYVLALARGQNPDPLERIATSKVTKVPSALSHLNPIILAIKNGDYKLHQMLLSLYGIYKLSSILMDLDTASITRKITSDQSIARDNLCKDFAKWLEANAERLNLNQLSNVIESVKFAFLSGSNGPNRKQSLLSADAESIVLRNDTKLWPVFSELCQSLGRPDIVSFIQQIDAEKIDSKNTILARSATVPENGNKHRAVGLLAFPFQQILYTLNSGIENVLENVFVNNNNCYWKNHDEILEACNNKLQVSGWSLSLDLSNATDAIPAELQREVLKIVFNGNIAQKWFELIRRIQFVTPKGGTVSYTVGQPMGSRDSFVLFTLTLCLLWLYQRQKAIEAGEISKDTISESNLFANVGDDNTGFNRIITDRWINSLQSCGVEFNKTKQLGLIGENQWVETCSRLSINGQDVSPISMVIIRNASKDWKELPSVLEQLIKINIPIDKLVTYLSELESLKKLTKSGKTPLELLNFVLQLKTVNDINPIIIGEEFKLAPKVDKILLLAKFVGLYLTLKAFFIKDYGTFSNEGWKESRLNFDLFQCVGVRIPEYTDPFHLNSVITDIIKDSRDEDDKDHPFTFLEVAKCSNLLKVGHSLSRFKSAVENRSFKLHQKSLTAIAHDMQDSGLELVGLIGSSTNRHQPGVLGQIMVINSLFGENNTLVLYSNANIKISCDISSFIDSDSLKIVDLLEIDILNGFHEGNYQLVDFISNDEFSAFEQFEQKLN